MTPLTVPRNSRRSKILVPSFASTGSLYFDRMLHSHARFKVLATLGTGGMGQVYEAEDLLRREVVAIKTLEHLDPWRLYCLKNEFRTLAGVAHPNLAALHELLFDGSRWLLVLERVVGQELNRWLKLDGDRRSHERVHVSPTTLVAPELASTVEGGGRSTTSSAMSANRAPLDVGRVRATFYAIASGIAALHKEGILHRDLKPSNVMVEDSGRVVILDFGLAVYRDRAETEWIRNAGTPEYIAPERLNGCPAEEASDWYSFGVMLYEALLGFLPYYTREAFSKQRGASLGAPHLVDARIPADLSRLLSRLLHVDPRERPAQREILDCLSRGLDLIETPSYAECAAGFFGRDRELSICEESLAAAAGGGLQMIALKGPSGVGKTALLDMFVRRLSALPDVLVLRSRCLSAETSPYKGVDGLIDQLALALMERVVGQVEPTPVLESDALLAMFPLLGHVPGLQHRQAADPADSERARRRGAVRALGALFQQLSRNSTLVLCVEDVQWGDEDGASILFELLADKLLERCLILTSSHGTASSGAAAWSRLEEVVAARSLELGPLPAADCERWLGSILGEGERAGLIPQLVELSGGHPVFLMQLAQLALEQRDLHGIVLHLDGLVGARLAELGDAPRELAQILALTARPLSLAALRSIAPSSLEAALRQLQAKRWVKSAGTMGSGRFEIAHDRLRTLIAESIDPAQLPAKHARIARGLVGDAAIEPELLSDHFARAGLHQEAVGLAIRAGKEALSALAFARAASMFERALSLTRLDADTRRAVLIGLATALQELGESQRAGDAWSEVARLTQHHEQMLEYERRAAEQWLICGQIERALSVLDGVVRTTGSPIPRTRVKALAEFAYYRTRVVLGEFRPRADSGSHRERERQRADALFAASRAISMLDAEFGLSLQARFHWHALRSRDPERMALALAWMACFRGIALGPNDRGYLGDITRAEALSAERREGIAGGFCAMARGTALVLHGEYVTGLVQLELAEQRLTRQRGAGAWERMFTRVVTAAALAWSGQLTRLTQRLDAWLRDADDRGDTYTATMLRLRAFNGLRYLTRDDPEGLLREVDAQLARWPTHYMAEDLSCRYAGWLRAFGELARGNATDAKRHMADVERRELVERVRLPHALRAEMELLRGLVELAQPRWEMARIRRSIARLSADPRAYGAPFALSLEAALTLRRGQDAGPALDRAAHVARDRGLYALAASAEFAAAELSGGRSGDQGERSLRAEGVVDPSRFSRLWFAPWSLQP